MLAVPVDEFYPFAQANGDMELPTGLDRVVDHTFPSPFLFYGQSFSFVGVSDCRLLVCMHDIAMALHVHADVNR